MDSGKVRYSPVAILRRTLPRPEFDEFPNGISNSVEISVKTSRYEDKDNAGRVGGVGVYKTVTCRYI